MPRRISAAAGGVVASAHSLASIIVNPLVGTAVQRSGYVGVVLGIAAWTVPLGLIWLVWPPRPREEPGGQG